MYPLVIFLLFQDGNIVIVCIMMFYCGPLFIFLTYGKKMYVVKNCKHLFYLFILDHEGALNDPTNRSHRIIKHNKTNYYKHLVIQVEHNSTDRSRSRPNRLRGGSELTLPWVGLTIKMN